MTVRIKETLNGRVTNADLADKATALSSSAGSTTLPVYFKDGKPTATSTSLAVGITGNAATATKLATARTIALTGSVTGSGTFDGSGNLSITTTTNHDHDSSYVKLDSTLNLPNVAGAWSGGKTLTNLPIHFANYSGVSTTLSSSNYHPLLGVSTTSGHIVNLGGYKDNVGFYGYYASQSSSTNATSWSVTIDSSTGKLTSTEGIITPTTETLASKASVLASGTKNSDATAYSVGSTTLPVYFKDGVPVATSTTLDVNISKNAATATKLATARTIALTGSVTGSGTFDGSGNLSITTTTNHTHSQYALLASDNSMSGTNTFTKQVVLGSNSQSSISSTGGIKVNDVRSATLTPESISQAANFYFVNSSNTPTTDWWSVLHVKGWSSSGYASWELAGNASTSAGKDLWFRDGVSSTWGSWKKILDSSNYTSYAPTKTGSGASGTWGISISGTAAKATALASTIGISLTGNVKGSVTGINAGSSAQIEANMKWAVYDDDDTNVES
jgi:uncharacterized protein (UPF0333 family)